MNSISIHEFRDLWLQVFAGRDRDVLLALTVLGLTVTVRLLRWRYRTRTERRLQAAAAAYAARELARERRDDPGQLGESGYAA